MVSTSKNLVVSRLSAIGEVARTHRRWLAVGQIALLAVFLGLFSWTLRGAFHGAAHDLENANLVLFGAACAALGAYYVVFVLGWKWILAEWGVDLPYSVTLRAEMVSMLAKYIPGGIWTPAARVVAARRAGVTDTALVLSSILPRGRDLGRRGRDRVRRQPPVRRQRARAALAARPLRRRCSSSSSSRVSSGRSRTGC